VIPNPRARVPAGFRATRSFPVVHVDEVPVFDPKTWDLRVGGLVQRPLSLTWEGYLTLPRVVRESDFHSVVGFSRLDNRWEGVLLRDLLARAGPRANARFVRFGDDRLYDTTIPLERALEDDTLLADTHDGQWLTPEHGAPLRVVVGGLLAWKSVKWVRTIELLEADRAGYWEKRGHPAHGDPFAGPARSAARP
jgi:DMSO/TMAO reductase YedYZ molybdopterin-dependent catalytic subunit